MLNVNDLHLIIDIFVFDSYLRNKNENDMFFAVVYSKFWMIEVFISKKYLSRPCVFVSQARCFYTKMSFSFNLPPNRVCFRQNSASNRLNLPQIKRFLP